MPLPTLMIKGKLAPPNGDPNLKRELDEWVPLDYVIEWLRSRMNKTGVRNRVLILKSETASGKSTAFPPELYKSLVRGTGDHAPGIICTQPRVLTAIENVNEMLKHYGKIMRLGESIGWSTKFNKLRPKSVGLLSATIGTLAQQLRVSTDEEIMDKYKFILIDETHERDLQTDMTIYMLKNLLIRNGDNIKCPFVVLMSATFDPKSFLDYFGLSLMENFIWCVGETAGFDEMWDWNDDRIVNDYPRAAATVVEKIVKDNPDDNPAQADILIFMPGKAEFRSTADWLHKLNKQLANAGSKVLSILQIDGAAVQARNMDYVRTMYIPINEHEIHIDNKKYTPSRRVIIATNVAETGLTLDNLKYVIDGGYNKEIEFNPVLGIRGLITKPAPKSRIKQRRGRSGRKFRGVFYPLYPQYIYNKLPDLQFPQILIEDISVIVLDIINEQMKVKLYSGQRNPKFLVEDIDMIDVPTPDALSYCMEKLYSLGLLSPISPRWDLNIENMISNETTPGVGITKLGALACSFASIPLESIRMILSAYFWECSVLDIITIAAYLLIDAKSFADADTKLVDEINWSIIYKLGLPGFISSTGMLYKIRLLIADEFIHGIILFNAIKQILSATTKDSINNLRNWCKQNKVSYKACLDLIRTRDDIIEQMLMNGFEVFGQEDSSIIRSTEDDFMTVITKIKYCIYDGYRNNLVVRDGTNYKTVNSVNVLPPKLFRENERRLLEKNNYSFALNALPKYMIYKELSLKYNRKSSIYEVVTDRVSVLDGFISVDPLFTI